MAYNLKPVKIESVKKINDDVKLFRIKSPINPRPGQFMEVSVPGIGECPLASCSFDKNRVDILLRNAGNVTSAIFKLKKGDTLFFRGPYGSGFPIKKIQGKNIILVAGGTGIAPITSLISYIEKNKRKFKKISIYFGFRNEEYILLKDRIKKWEKKFNVTICLEKASRNKKCKKGFINDFMNSKNTRVENTVALMCGPEIMMKNITKKLNQLGMKNDSIYWSMERRMECGMGSCGRCLIQDVYTCIDGPVFRYDFIKPRLDNEEDANRR